MPISTLLVQAQKKKKYKVLKEPEESVELK